MSSGLNPNDKVIQKVLNILFNNYKNYEDLINYWALDSGEPLTDCFALTPIIRKLKYQIIYSITKFFVQYKISWHY